VIRHWTDKEIKDLKKRFATTRTQKLADKYGRPFLAVKKMASRLGLRKTAKMISKAHSGKRKKMRDTTKKGG